MLAEMSKRALRIEAERLGADEILGRKSNIYMYEVERYNLCKKLGCSYEGWAYSAGACGNTGRIDELKKPNGEHIKFIFYTE